LADGVATTPEATRPRLRPLSLGEILDVSIKICLAHWRTLLKAVLVVVVPVQIASTILTADYTVSSFDLSSSKTSQQTIDELNQYLGGVAISSLLQVCAVLLATAACFRAIAQAYLGETTDWRSSLSFALHLAPSLLLLTLLYVLGVLLGTAFFLAPGIWLYVAWAFAMPALLVEGLRGRKALRRSFELVKGRWWRTFGIIAVGFILAGIISTVVQGAFLIGIVVGADNDALVLVLATIAGIVGAAVTTPFQAALLTVLYFDLRVRKEGFDLELLAEGIAGSGPRGTRGLPTVLPPDEEIDRTGAPFWPPPPGWKPPGSGATGAGGSQPPPTPEPRPTQEPRPTPEPPLWPDPPRTQEPSAGPHEREPPPDEPLRLPGVPHEPEPPTDEPPRLPGVPHE
jgi:Membrane domain of glycerophosphoryl diester phosphodiesterase